MSTFFLKPGRFRLAFSLSLLLGGCFSAIAQEKLEAPTALAAFAKTHCLACHDAKKAEGGFDLSDLLAGANVSANPAGWHAALERMPTESEWEYAARAGSDGLGGKIITDVAWCRSNSEMKPHPVGTKAPNAWVLYDMLGNANEWAKSEKWIGYRSGCWRTLDSKCKPTHREGHGVVHSDPYGGFRVVVEAQ